MHFSIQFVHCNTLRNIANYFVLIYIRKCIPELPGIILGRNSTELKHEWNCCRANLILSLNIREFLFPRLDVLMQNLSYFLIAKPTSIFPWAFAYSHHARMCYNEKSSQTKSAVSLGRKRLVMFTPEGYFCHMPIIIFIVSFFRKLILLGIFTKIFIRTFFCSHNFV